ncbi:unnamed protein product [Parascedosporium putredinis]|uniref:DNA mismatch repair protein S5 domain-containing protein n=1 Tax=Parascedosporium putredinis TaxID=1442378 RepID=A0A9P1MAZ5_9PEZI|nr:unnamed protein product [Parascedosporium putredinis]CAI7995017.1 unnamed protein product [Parascedosporium putredinis]
MKRKAEDPPQGQPPPRRIKKDDLAILCERHTTSKLSAFEDLREITTYGFRGEALASISQIAHLSVTTKTKDSPVAWQAKYLEGAMVPQKPGMPAEPKSTAGRQGTQIKVEDLFFNIPIRRKAFRSPGEEFTKIMDMTGRYAVHCQHVAFSCKKAGDASIGLSVSANASTVDRIRQIYGSDAANELIEFTLEINPQSVDVNVHPTKRHVKFEHEEEIVQAICETISSKLAVVDKSRTFMTQTLLPGIKVTTISPSPTARHLVRRVKRQGQVGANGVEIRTSCVKELKAEVREEMHNELTDIFSDHSFVGIVDEQRRLAAMQGGIKLYLVDYGHVCYEYFYQVGLTDFGNFGTIRFTPPLDLRETLRIAAEMESRNLGDGEDDFDVEALVEKVAEQLLERREMLAEYFALEISPQGSSFLLGLGPSVNWMDEKACFETFLRELATFYVPEQLPQLPGDEESAREEDIDEEVKERRRNVRWAVEHVLFPAFKARLVATKSLMASGMMEVADLKGLYRVFERC